MQVYTDISAEWVSGDDSLTVNWTTTVGDIIMHQVQLEQQTVFGEVDDRIQRRSNYLYKMSSLVYLYSCRGRGIPLNISSM